VTARHYTVQELALRAGVTVKTLHHYDGLGLLQPARTTARYRVHSDAGMLRLRQILALRALRLPLRRTRQLLALGAIRAIETAEADLDSSATRWTRPHGSAPPTFSRLHTTAHG